MTTFQQTKANNAAFDKGYDQMSLEIFQLGWNGARDKYNLDNPIGIKYASLEGYHYAKGGIQCLMGNK